MEFDAKNKIDYKEQYYKKGWSHGYDQAIETLNFIYLSFGSENNSNAKNNEILDMVREMKYQLDNFR